MAGYIIIFIAGVWCGFFFWALLAASKKEGNYMNMRYCENCNNYEKDGFCKKHKVNVNENNTCRQFSEIIVNITPCKLCGEQARVIDAGGNNPHYEISCSNRNCKNSLIVSSYKLNKAADYWNEKQR